MHCNQQSSLDKRSDQVQRVLPLLNNRNPHCFQQCQKIRDLQLMSVQVQVRQAHEQTIREQLLLNIIKRRRRPNRDDLKRTEQTRNQITQVHFLPLGLRPHIVSQRPNQVKHNLHVHMRAEIRQIQKHLFQQWTRRPVFEKVKVNPKYFLDNILIQLRRFA